MKKDCIFAPIMLIIGVMLFLLRETGMQVHIAVSVVGLATLIAYAVATKKTWKLPVLEIIMRVCYGIALVTGVVMMKVHGVAAIAIAHKAGAALFVVLLAALFVHKLITGKKA